MSEKDILSKFKDLFQQKLDKYEEKNIPKIMGEHTKCQGEIMPFFSENEIFAYKRTDLPASSNINTGASALNYVLEKKWSMENVPCSLNGGAFFEFRRDIGEEFTAGGKSTLTKDAAPRKFEYIDKGSKSFTYKEISYANDTVTRFLGEPNAITAEREMEVTLVEPQIIKVNSKITKINFDKKNKLIIKYNEKNKTYTLFFI
jgi:hypothetical protein